MKKTKTNKKKWFSEKLQLHESFSSLVPGDVQRDNNDKIEENVEHENMNSEAEVEEAEVEEAEVEEAESYSKNSRDARLEGLRERMNNKKTWK